MKNTGFFWIFHVVFIVFLQFSVVSRSQPNNTMRTDSLKSELARAGTDTLKMRLLEALYVCTECKDARQSNAYVHQYLAIARTANNDKAIGKAYRWLGFIAGNCKHDYTVAVYWYNKAVAIAATRHDRKEEAALYANLAQAYAANLSNATALDYYTRSMALDPDPDKVKGTLGNMGSLYMNIADYPNAAECFEKAYRIQYQELTNGRKKTTNDTLNLAGLLISLADMRIYMSQYDEALNNYRLSKEFNRNIGNKLVDLWVLLGTGKCYQLKGAYDQAIQHFTDALRISRELKDAETETEILNKLGNIALTKGQQQKAMELAKSALAVSGQQPNPSLPGTYHLLGRIYAASNDFTQAVGYLQQAIDLYHKAGKTEEESAAWSTMSSTYSLMNRTSDAFAAYRQYIALRDSVFSLDKARQITSTELRGEFDRKQIADSLTQARKDIAVRLHMQRQRSIMYGGFAGLAMVLLLSFFVYRNYSQQKRANTIITNANKALTEEQQVSEALLLNILPADVAEELKRNGSVKAKLYDNVTVLMTDFAGFTQAGERMSPEALVAELHTCFEAFDNILGRHGIEKIKTVGDAYLAVCGLPHAVPDHAVRVVRAAIDISAFMRHRLLTHGSKTFGVRIGIHTGSVVAGIVGVRKFAYDIWGDTVNTAARMEQHAEEGRINLSETTFSLVKDQVSCEYRGEVEAKGKGIMKMYYVTQ
jgi:class 3 adenylate cyclase/uncharacterized protein HemY